MSKNPSGNPGALKPETETSSLGTSPPGMTPENRSFFLAESVGEKHKETSRGFLYSMNYHVFAHKKKLAGTLDRGFFEA